MKTALIGYTGFVGSNILDQHPFDETYNSKNFRDMRGREFGEVVCAGISAVKWLANKNPVEDKQKIRELEDILSTIKAERFILISTIDVYPGILGEDESYDCAAVPNNAYGTHRLEFEQFCKEKFADCYIIRLPGLFGRGLKKNVIFDLLNHNCLEMINPESSFQYYDLSNIWSDIVKVVSSGTHLVNLFTEPVATRDIIDRFFAGETFVNLASNASPETHYALKSRYDALWGGSDGYIYDKEHVLAQMGAFIEQSRKGNK